MTPLSPSALLTWQIAANEAQTTHAREIEPTHLTIAFSKLCDTDLSRLIPDSIAPQEREEIETEVNNLRQKCDRAGIDLSKLRRRLRGIISQPPSNIVPTSMHRSAATKEVFQWAETLAEGEGKALQLSHLLQALLESPTAPQTKIFVEMGIENPRDRLFEETLNHQESQAVTEIVHSLESIPNPQESIPETLRVVEAAIARNPALKNPGVIEKAVKRNPKLRKILQVGGIELLKVIFPPIGIPIAMILVWLEESDE